MHQYVARDAPTIPNVGYQPPTAFSFAVDQIHCTNMRSRPLESDTLSLSISVAVSGGHQDVTEIFLGDHHKGDTVNTALSLDNINVSDEDIVIFSYLLVNDGGDPQAKVKNTTGDAVKKLVSTGIDATVQKATDVAIPAAVEAMGTLIDSAVPIIGPLISAALGALGKALISVLDANCNGPVASGAMTISGKDLKGNVTATGGVWTHHDTNPGSESPAGCGSNSLYETTWGVRKD